MSSGRSAAPVLILPGLPKREPLVIFDCDGVLVDSEVVVIALEVEMFADLGVELTAEEISRTFVGLKDAEIHRRIEERFAMTFPPGFDDEKRDRVTAALDTDLRVVPGMPGLLAALETRRCVASSSRPFRIRRSLELTGLLPHLDPHLYSTNMVERGKPFPDVFLHAAADMGAEPADCVVVEDSTHGVEGAVAAGMRVIGFTAAGHCTPDTGERLLAAGAHEIAPDAATLAALLP